MRPIRVCCFCESWESGGIESFLCNILCRMDPEKVCADVVVSCLKESIFTERMRACGIQFRELSGNQRSILQNGRLFFRLLKEQKYDVVHFHLFQGFSLRYVYLAKKASVPVRIVHSHNTALRNSVAKPLKLCIHHVAKHLFARFATDFWACSSEASDFMFPKREAKSFRWIPNGIRTEQFRFNEDVREEVRNEFGLSNSFVIGNIGRLCYQKNQLFLVDVFAEVLKHRPESRLLLIGVGNTEAALRARARKIHIEDRIIFYGVSAHPEKLLWAMDVFAFPSRFEGLGIAVVEAQATGLPVVCSAQIPKEALVTALVQRIALHEGAGRWAAMLLADRDPTCEREAYAEFVRQSGFGISDTATLIEDFYVR